MTDLRHRKSSKPEVWGQRLQLSTAWADNWFSTLQSGMWSQVWLIRYPWLQSRCILAYKNMVIAGDCLQRASYHSFASHWKVCTEGGTQHTCCNKLRPQSAPVYYMQIWLAMCFSHFEDRSNPRAGVPKQQAWVISYTGQLCRTARLEYNIFYSIWVALMTTPAVRKFTDKNILRDMFNTQIHMMLLITMIGILSTWSIVMV